jgi:prepilin-type N-terminal cleavage/methylation domain-containing protein
MMKLRSSRGYSLIELLVVIAIIGALSLVTVPMFMNFQRRNAVRSSLRAFTSDLRSYRQHAITKNAYVRVQFTGERDYTAMISTDFGKKWDELQLGGVGAGSATRTLPETMRFSANTFNDSDDPVDKKPDIDFHPDGMVGDFDSSNVATAGTITLRTDWSDILNQVLIEISTTGQIKTTESKS